MARNGAGQAETTDLEKVEVEVRDKVEELKQEARDKVASEIENLKDELDDELSELFPLGLLLPLMSNFLTKRIFDAMTHIFNFFVKHALIHLVTIEFLPVYFFYYSVRSQLLGILVAVNMHNNASKKLNAKISLGIVEKCLKLQADQAIMGKGDVDIELCVTCNADSTDAKCKGKSSPYLSSSYTFPLTMFYWIHLGCMALCAVFAVYMVIMFLWRCGLTMRIANGKYPQFVFQVRRTKMYRYIAGAFICAGCVSLAGLLYAAYKEKIMTFVLETQLSSILIVILSMNAFVLPTKPKFEYRKQEFGDILFKRTSFFQGNSGFSRELSTAVIQASRGTPAHLKKLLMSQAPSEWRRVRTILMNDSLLKADDKSPRLLGGKATEMIEKFSAVKDAVSEEIP